MNKKRLDQIKSEYRKQFSAIKQADINSPLINLVDVAIYKPIAKLNQIGLTTIESCAGGHKGNYLYHSRGYIVFKHILNKEQQNIAYNILESFGLKLIKFKSMKYKGKKDTHTQASFTGLGGNEAPGLSSYLAKIDKLNKKYKKLWDKEINK